MNPLGVAGALTLPPRLVLRALDDLHAIANASREISGALDSFERRSDAVIEQVNTGVALLGRIAALGERIEAMGERIDARAEAVLQMGERIDARAEAILRMGAGIQESANAVLTQGTAIEQSARELARSGDTLAEALPTLQRGLELAEPLEGVVERVGRMVDRLPGGARRTQSPEAPPE